LYGITARGYAYNICLTHNNLNTAKRSFTFSLKNNGFEHNSEEIILLM